MMSSGCLLVLFLLLLLTGWSDVSRGQTTSPTAAAPTSAVTTGAPTTATTSAPTSPAPSTPSPTKAPTSQALGIYYSMIYPDGTPDEIRFVGRDGREPRVVLTMESTSQLLPEFDVTENLMYFVDGAPWTDPETGLTYLSRIFRMNKRSEDKFLSSAEILYKSRERILGGCTTNGDVVFFVKSIIRGDPPERRFELWYISLIRSQFGEPRAVGNVEPPLSFLVKTGLLYAVSNGRVMSWKSLAPDGTKRLFDQDNYKALTQYRDWMYASVVNPEGQQGFGAIHAISQSSGQVVSLLKGAVNPLGPITQDFLHVYWADLSDEDRPRILKAPITGPSFTGDPEFFYPLPTRYIGGMRSDWENGAALVSPLWVLLASVLLMVLVA